MPNVCAEYNRTMGNLQIVNITWSEVVCEEQSQTLSLDLDLFCGHIQLLDWTGGLGWSIGLVCCTGLN